MFGRSKQPPTGGDDPAPSPIVGPPTPIRFLGVEHHLAWAGPFAPAYLAGRQGVIRGYLPAGEQLEAFHSKVEIALFRDNPAPGELVHRRLQALEQRKQRDPLVNYAVTSHPLGEWSMIDFLVSTPDGQVVEWAAELAYSEAAGGTLQRILALRGYGAGIRDFLTGLEQRRARAIEELLQGRGAVSGPG